MNFDTHTQPCFSAIIGFADLDTNAQADGKSAQLAYMTLSRHIEALLGYVPQGAAGGHLIKPSISISGDGAQIAYAIAALADEMAMKSAPVFADYWPAKTLLQVRYFDEHAAGDHFFDRLENLFDSSTSAAVLSAYYTALVLGFQGRYASAAQAGRLGEAMTKLRARLAEKTKITSADLAVACSGASSCGSEICAAAQTDRWAWWTSSRGWRAFFFAVVACSICFALSSWYLRRLARPLFTLAAQCAALRDEHAALGP